MDASNISANSANIPCSYYFSTAAPVPLPVDTAEKSASTNRCSTNTRGQSARTIGYSSGYMLSTSRCGGTVCTRAYNMGLLQPNPYP